jgi:hypothetical protein
MAGIIAVNGALFTPDFWHHETEVKLQKTRDRHALLRHNSPRMFRWITKSRLRTSIAIVLFGFLFIAGVVIDVVTHPSQAAVVTSLVTTIVSAVGTISTVFFAWRTDRRTAKESELKLIQMQQQILELQGSWQHITSPSVESDRPTPP